MSHPSNITRSQTLRVAADLIEAAEENGSRADVLVTCVTPGEVNLSIISTTEVSHRDIAAWQQATTGVWEVRSSVWCGSTTKMRCRTVDFDYRGVKMSLMLSQPVAEVAA